MKSFQQFNEDIQDKRAQAKQRQDDSVKRFYQSVQKDEKEKDREQLKREIKQELKNE